MSLYDTKLAALDGTPDVLANEKGKVTLMVNVASFCGLTPQYEGLQQLEEKYKAQGFDVIGIPCNQFGEQEPGTPDEIKTFCSTNYNVTFPHHREDRGQRRRPSPALPGAHRDRRRRRPRRRHPVELREVPRGPRRQRDRALLADGAARGARGGRLDREGAGRLSEPTAPTGDDWVDWHRAYDAPGSSLAAPARDRAASHPRHARTRLRPGRSASSACARARVTI